MTFGPWEIPDEEFISTVGALERARQIDPFRVGPVDISAGTVQVVGSDGSRYSVTLDGCDCTDFQRRGLPCKHMLRLALEIGLPMNVPQFDPCAAADYDVEEEIAHLADRWRSGQLTFEALTKCASALRSSARQAKRPRGRPKKKV